MNKQKFIDTANDRYRKARDFWRNWRVQARDDYSFVAGNQWLEEDLEILREQKRPPITFNYSEKMIDAVIGAEVNSRQEVHYAPRGVEDGPQAEVWNAAAKWARDECNAEDEESDAYRDMLTCGMGWTWTRISYEEDLDGKLIIERIDPLEMLSDPAASKTGITDRRFHFREWYVDEEEVRRTWPNAMSAMEEEDAARGVIRHGDRYNDDKEDEADRHKDQMLIRLYETYELEPVYRVVTANGIEEMNADQFDQIKERLDATNTPYVRQQKRVYYRAFFSGDTLLEMGKSPCQRGFAFQALTGKRDRNKNTWYGLTQVMKDPQRWANKWLSQIMYIINSNAKGGLMAEVGAFLDPKRAQEEWAQPDSITLFNEGAISQGKVIQKQQAPYPAGLDKLMTFALDSLPMVTGINLEALGLANREQAGVLEAQRKQAAYGILAPLFDALRRYRKEQGHVLLYYINEYISDGRLVRIGGPESQQYVPLMKAQGAMRYDIIVDTAPTAPDTKEKTWETLKEIIPAMLKAGVAIPPAILDFSPLPTALTTQWKQFIGQQQQVSQQMQQQMQALQQENDQLKHDQAIKVQELQLKQQESAAKIQMQREDHEQQMQLERLKAQSQFELESFKQDREFELEARRVQHEAAINQQRADGELRIKAFAQGIAEDGKPETERKVSIGVDTTPFANVMQQLASSQQQNSEVVLAAIQRLSEALSRPRRLVTDQAGRPIGSEPVPA